MAKDDQGESMTIAESALPEAAYAKSGSQEETPSFEALFRQHYQRVYGILFRLVGNKGEAEDITQEVFLKLYRNPPAQSADHNWGAWLYRVATNAGYNHIRGRKRQWQRNIWLVPGADRVHDDPSAENPVRQVEQKETQAMVRTALAQLKPQQGQLLLLRQMGFSYAELAEACQISPNSVGVFLSRAAKAFEKAYKQMEAKDGR